MEKQLEALKLQSAEFDAANDFAKALKMHGEVSVVDDDYPQVRHRYEAALTRFIEAMKDNGRFKPGSIDSAKWGVREIG